MGEAVSVVEAIVIKGSINERWEFNQAKQQNDGGRSDALLSTTISQRKTKVAIGRISMGSSTSPESMAVGNVKEDRQTRGCGSLSYLLLVWVGLNCP